MQIKMKRTLVLSFLVAALLAGLIGGFVKIGVTKTSPSEHHNTQQLAWYCGAPPVVCM